MEYRNKSRYSTHLKNMKAIMECSIYLIIMALICLLSIDFVSMNMGITEVGQMEQYVEDYIELNGECQEDNLLDVATVEQVSRELEKVGMTFSYEYMDSTESHAYYKVQVQYSIRSAIFNFAKPHTFDGIARVDI